MRARFFRIALLALLLGSFRPSRAAPAAPWMAKVDPRVLAAAAGGEADFIVFLKEQADLSGAEALETKLAKGQFVYKRLTETASRSQGPVIRALQAAGAEYRPYWIANMIWARGDLDLVQRMAARPEVGRIYANPTIRLDIPLPETPPFQPQAVEAVEWNIDKIRAPEVWAEGYRGQGVVIGGQDTGYDWDHPALKNQYRGWNGVQANHNYNWHDAIHESSRNSECPAESKEPCDDFGHGTHTMGIAVGADASRTNQIGVAPRARWIGCRNMDGGRGTPVTYSECFQWFLAPTDLNGLNPDPSRAPDVINNSWGCTAEEGCTEPNVLRTAVEAVRAAGIVTVQSAGNGGPQCGSVDTPAAIYEASFTVGNTTRYDSIAASSGRGPVVVDGSNRIKPDVVAPGTGIRSSYPGGIYTTLSGTSMAAPHVAGLVALLLSAQPELLGKAEQVEQLIRQNALPFGASESCGEVPGEAIPNNVYGWGRIDAWSALRGNALSLEVSVSSVEAAPGETLVYTLTVTHTSVSEPTNNLVLVDPLPANTEFVSATPAYAISGREVRWNFARLEPNESVSVELTVRTPRDYMGRIENSGSQVSSREVDRPVFGNTVTTQVSPPFGVFLAPEYYGMALPGAEVTYVHSITNTGRKADYYEIELSSSRRWASVTDTGVMILPGESVTLEVRVSVPGNAPLNQVDLTTLTVTSLTDETATTSVTDVTEVGRGYFLPYASFSP